MSLFWLAAGLDFQNSPDEHVALLFTEKIAVGDFPRFYEPDNHNVQGIIHPRSALAIGDWVVPGSFLGLPLIYGLFGAIIHSSIIPFLTPVVFLLSILAFWMMTKRYSDSSEFASIATLFYALHPAMWYYAARSMMHNVPFISFIIIGLWFIAILPHKKKWINWLLAGVFLGAAISMRTVEVFWLIPSLLILAFILLKPNRDWRRFFVALAGMVFAIAPVLLLQQVLYGSWTDTGYTAEYAYESIEVLDLPEIVPEQGVRGGILPFGIHERVLLRNTFHYGFSLYPWMTIFGIAGLLMALLNPKKKQWFYLAIATMIISCWLFLYYGSWIIFDNPDPRSVTIGNSYVRYWIPIFTLLAPFSALSIQACLSHCRDVYRNRILAGLIVFMITLSGFTVLGGPDGLLATRMRLNQIPHTVDKILDHTEEDAIVITEYADKYLYPDRKTVVPLRSELTYAALGKLAERGPLYYFGITLPEEDQVFLQEERLRLHGLQLETVTQIDEQTLYRFSHE